LGPIGLDSSRSYMIFLAVLFCVVGAGVIFLRRGPFGRRLQAMKDSPAACATLGLDLTRTKVAVFAFSAAIAGFGGALFGGTSGSVSSENFLFEQTLPVVLMGVSGGISLVSGALFGGVLFVLFGVIAENFTLLDSVLFLGPLIANLPLVAPGFVGIAMARNPDGAVAAIISGSRRVFTWARSGRLSRPTAPAPVDTAGFDAPLTDEELVAVDRELGIDERELEHATPGG
jgi:branched-chain amino acid transport system permease protein